MTSLAQYIPSLGVDIATSGGTLADRDQGLTAAMDYRGSGAVLDTYTAVVAAEIEVFEILRSWFGTLRVARSTVDEIDVIIARASADLGRGSISVGFSDGQYVKQEVTDEFLQQQLKVLDTIKERIEDHCEILTVALPDDVSDEVADFGRKMGNHILDPMFLAASQGDVLLSEDLYYRQIAASLTKVDGTWLQAVLLAARGVGLLTRSDQSRFFVALAKRRHGNLWLDLPSLDALFEESTAEGFASACHFVGALGADMRAHALVTLHFLNAIWGRKNPALKREARTTCIITALLRNRPQDWAFWFALVWLGADEQTDLRGCLFAWLRGHFLATEPVEKAVRWWSTFLQRDRQPKAQDVCTRAMMIYNEQLTPYRAGFRHSASNPTSPSRFDATRKHRTGRPSKSRVSRKRRKSARYVG